MISLQGSPAARHSRWIIVQEVQINLYERGRLLAAPNKCLESNCKYRVMHSTQCQFGALHRALARQ